jgi:hypothetical protein
MKLRRPEPGTRFSSGTPLAPGLEDRSPQIVIGTYIDLKCGAPVTVLQGPREQPRRAIPCGHAASPRHTSGSE